jgi:hypothetical protein
MVVDLYSSVINTLLVYCQVVEGTACLQLTIKPEKLNVSSIIFALHQTSSILLN